MATAASSQFVLKETEGAEAARQVEELKGVLTSRSGELYAENNKVKGLKE